MTEKQVEKREQIVAPAVQFKENKEVILVGYSCHGDFSMRMQAIQLGLPTDFSEMKHYERGFVTSQSRFVSRADAYKIAQMSGQLRKKTYFQELFSDDVHFPILVPALKVDVEGANQFAFLGVNYDNIRSLLGLFPGFETFESIEYTEGFVNKSYMFLTKEKAFSIAVEKKIVSGASVFKKCLYPEDLY